MLGAQQKIIGFRDDLLESEKEYLQSHMDPLDNPLNWTHVFFNSITEEVVGEPTHDLLINPKTGEQNVPNMQPCKFNNNLLLFEDNFLSRRKTLLVHHLKAKKPYFLMIKLWVPPWYPINCLNTKILSLDIFTWYQRVNIFEQE